MYGVAALAGTEVVLTAPGQTGVLHLRLIQVPQIAAGFALLDPIIGGAVGHRRERLTIDRAGSPR